jgi:hypothetical protein
MISGPIVSRVVPGLILAALLAGAVYKIDERGYARAKTKYEAEISVLKLSHLSAVRNAELEANQRFVAQNHNMLRLSESLIAANATIDAQLKKLQERTRDVSTLYRPQPSAPLQSIPDWIVTHGWVCDYNRAIGYGASPVEDSASVSGAENTSCTAEPFSASQVSAERILAHHEEYGAYCRKLEQQVDRLIRHIDFVESEKSKLNDEGPFK